MFVDVNSRNLTQLKMPTLTKEEQSHIDKGGRLLIVEKIPGPMWRVLLVRRDSCKVFLKPDGAEGYLDYEDARLNALAIANLASDNPVVRE